MGWLTFGALMTATMALAGLLFLRMQLSAARAELVRVRAELGQSDRRLRLLEAAVEQADELVALVSDDYRIEHANDAFCRAVGYESDDLIGMDCRELLAQESRELFTETKVRASEAGLRRVTYTHRRQDGSTFPAVATLVPVSDADGTTDHLVLVERDITEETRLRDQLIHTERLSAVGQLVSGVAHELNNPLQSILGFAELLIETEERAQNRRDLEQIRAEAVRAGKIVRNLLAFVRRSSAERVLQNINDLAKATLALRAYEFGSANITLREDYAEELPPVWVNREEIQQVLLNLILNAEHAMRTAHQGGTLSVRTRLVGANVVVEVKDSGPGIPPKLAGRVFEPFFSSKGVGEGTGLGLSIALGIAEAHGGLLSVQPTASGACFRLTVPASRPAEPIEPGRVDPTVPTRRVLVADDEPGLRATLQGLLMRRGLTVDLAVDDGVALSLLKRNDYGLVFCDLRLPQMGGLAFYTRVADQYGALARNFVFIASEHLDPDAQALITRSRIPVLIKPFSAVELDEMIGRLHAAPTA